MNTKVRYIENKKPDFQCVEQLLSISASRNHWSNFGPLSYQLEEKITQLIDLDDDLRVVVCANATIALHTLVTLHDIIYNKNLRWDASAFGFYSSIDGNLKKANIVDCDAEAMMDLDHIIPSTTDGLVVTNTFGQKTDARLYEDYAKEHGLSLIIDSAMGFQAGGHIANECISLHHTKPWGFGEGGCAIVHKDHETLFRSLISFGHDKPEDPINRLAVNGKISEVACAYILMRLEQMQVLREQYLEQYERIAHIGLDMGLSILGNARQHPGTPASVPFLYDDLTSLPENLSIPARKYYHPLENTKEARNIFNRIINIPCHVDMKALSDQTIYQFLFDLQQTYTPKPALA